jgi:predicted DCC family thiol-disulfide oxidoreductase YuxK
MFAPLESEIAKQYLMPLMPDYLKEDTIVYYENGKVYLRSDAIIRINKRIGFPYNLIQLMTLFPKGMLDGIYNWIAGRRHTFGKKFESCPLPPAKWRDRFIQ